MVELFLSLYDGFMDLITFCKWSQVCGDERVVVSLKE
jgi:hypothetical protein